VSARVLIVVALLCGGLARAEEVASPVATTVPTTTAPTTTAPTTTAPTTTATSTTMTPRPRLLSELKGDVEQDLGGRAMGLVGMVSMMGIAWLLSTDRRRVSWRLVGMGVVLQLGFALFVLKTAAGASLFAAGNDLINGLLQFSEAGSRFVFGNLVDNKIAVGLALSPSPDDPRVQAENLFAATGSMIAFRVLPTVLFFSALTAVSYHLGLLQKVVNVLAAVMHKTMGVSGAESLSTSANIFLGQTEAPLLVRPYLEKMTASELTCIMTGGFATVAGGVMAAYVGMLSSTFPDIAGHLMAASVMAAPATLVMSKLMVPETEVPETAAGAAPPSEKLDANVIDAATRGISEGLMLALNVAAMLIGFLALIALFNAVIGGVGGFLGVPGISLERLFGVVGAPIAFLLGTPAEDAVAVGQLIGTKTVVNEFVAYLQLGGLIDSGQIVHGKSVVIAVYALCGFANFGSIGIQIGGLAALMPSRRSDLARLGLRSMIAGSLASFQTAAIAAMVL
jgi:concentrative nucleoside transporter, CNT family